MLSSRLRQRFQPVLLVILDGWGEAESWGGNPISVATTPALHELYRNEFHTQLDASGPAVGLPGHEQGNSEVGHLTIGAGRALVQDRTRISAAIADGSFARNPVLHELLTAVKQTGRRLHLVGLTSPGGVHSHIDHLKALMQAARDHGLTDLFIHAITDGRDTLPRDGLSSLDQIRHWTTELGVGQIASIIGRSYAMDRDEHWDRIETTYRLLVAGVGQRAPTPLAALSAAYAAGLSDEFVRPTVIDGSFQPLATGDTVILFNFRQDRARELLTSLTDPSFSVFKRPNHPALTVGTMIPYWYDDRQRGVRALFMPAPVTGTLGAAIADAGGRQLRIAETEKYAHVTYFLNGGVEAPVVGEERILVPSNLHESAALQPALQTLVIGAKLQHALKAGQFDCLIANIAAPDMVGHTGDFQATITACEVVDQLLGQLVTSCRATGTVLVVTADHGNAEQLLNPVTNEPDTHHTTNPVPFVIFDPRGRVRGLSRPVQTLADVAPTVLTIMGIPVPATMTGQSLASVAAKESRA